jgi:pimeloyl-ACP methyl ester carboxylesterase
MPFIESGGVDIYYEEYGTGRPLVFLHGFTLDRRMWRRQIEFFSRTHRVIVYDSRGHGKSGCPVTGYSRAHRVADLWQLVQQLHLERFHLVGLSMGGATALGYAIDHQQTLASLTLVDSAAGGYRPPQKFNDMREVARTEGVEEAKRRWVKTTLFYYANRNEALRQELGEIMAGHCGHLWLDPGRDQYRDRDDVALSSTITVPTLIFVGAKDRYFLPLAKMLHKNIAASEIDIVPDVGHMLNMEAPDHFNYRLRQFLDRADARQ